MYKLGVGILLVVGLSACPSDKEETTCETNAECGVSQVCDEGSCRDLASGECTGDPDCDPGFECIESQCIDREVDMGNPDPDMGDTEDMDERDLPRDEIPPEVVSVDPADGTLDVAVRPTLTIELSEPPQPTTINFQTVSIVDPSNEAVTSTVAHTPGTTTITITPDADLLSATGYRLVLNENVRDMAFNPLTRFESSFVTTYDEPQSITDLAYRFAPVIYQALGSNTPGDRNLDMPTTIDVDGNLEAAGNLENGAVAAIQPRANVYYSVVSSETHHFLLYVLYYIGRKIDEDAFEHDFTGVMFVVDKATGDFKVAEGIKVQQSGMDTIIGFKPDSSDVSGVADPQNLFTFDAATFEGERYAMYVPPNQHEACHFFESGPAVPVICRHEVGQFPDDDNTLGLVLRPGVAGEQGQRIGEAVEDQATQRRTLNYALVPMISTLWAQRSLTGPNAVWQATQLYRPIGDRPGSPDIGPILVLPTRLSSATQTNFGKPPFQWFPSAGENNDGQWLIDPAFILPSRYGFQETFSDQYCFNAILGINRLGENLCPE